ncbi:MAG: 23S rRNA pseudouridine2605 synthase [Kiritimatiellia bacterium]|jgi:23S rRNA pseudouridine2605 synthase
MTNEVALGRLLSARGVASRRKAEKLIFDGMVTVDGALAEHPAMLVDPSRNKVVIDSVPLPDEQELRYYLLYKTKGCITGRDDPQGRKSIFDLMPEMKVRVEPVGRLDFDTEGALLLTNDGTLAHALAHPSRMVPKRYRVKVWKTPSEMILKKIRAGKVYLEDGVVPACKVRVLDATDGGNAWVEITVTEGRNRLIRRLFDQMGHPVSKLRRESFATIALRDMQRGEIRALTGDEINRLRDQAAGKRPESSGKKKYGKGYARPKPKKPRHGRRKPRRQ